MKIILAAPRGFCAGVNMAIECLDLSIKTLGPPVYVYHEIVHNKYVVETFQGKGAIFVDSLEDVPFGSNLLFSAHGISPQIREQARERDLYAIDATCPLVTKVHLEAVRYAKEGFTILLIGHEGHDEVIGTMGEAPTSMILVENEEDVDRIQVADESKVAYLTQTTLSVDDANRIIDKIRERFPEVKSPPKGDICYATQNRQEAVRIIADDVQLVLVVGSQNSSNSQRLKEIAIEQGKRAYLIDGVEDIDDQWFDSVETLMITAGASAPENLVQDCIEYIRKNFGAELESRVIREEKVHFNLPKELKALL
ncbi:MAG: 4-hydroxy-3-methylbut-2-enyl diphosphate reductase [Pirellulales bacterium]|jgi:4-hydroxy-3-methylbut-2-enyl diphosphate reductase|nr:4-hydroxy-3-methylbut-2-enyl diphosphate reductase [Rhodopirellula sp.]MCH2371174.1 4-hydroxy-3-methylbut-2-enyl diphosphate reductase [Pirellulales bacterium]|tara:strand:+ start:1199 stop:2128 length:930 start_codon:yes stop_codon:yes gene_type:complete